MFGISQIEKNSFKRNTRMSMRECLRAVIAVGSGAKGDHSTMRLCQTLREVERSKLRPETPDSETEARPHEGSRTVGVQFTFSDWLFSPSKYQ